MMTEHQISGRSRNRIMGLPNVVGVGLGRKIRGGHDMGTEALVVLVETKVHRNALPANATVPAEIDGILTDVIQVGRLSAVRPDRGSSIRKKRVRPAPGGVSIGHPDITAGTLGVMVWDSDGPLILSNNHVLANSSTNFSGKPVVFTPTLQPGPYDGAIPVEDVIGNVERFVPLKRRGSNRFDAAVTRPASPDLLSPEILEIGTLSGVADPEIDMKVIKSGRSSGVTRGIITVVDATVSVDYGDYALRFDRQVVTDLVSDGGDSGSVIVDGDRRVLGLLFAGSDEVTVFSPAAPLAKTLGFSYTP